MIYKLSELWTSDLWTVGLMSRRTYEPSDLWAVGLMSIGFLSRRTYEYRTYEHRSNEHRTYEHRTYEQWGVGLMRCRTSERTTREALQFFADIPGAIWTIQHSTVTLATWSTWLAERLFVMILTLWTQGGIDPGRTEQLIHEMYGVMIQVTCRKKHGMINKKNYC